MALITRVPMLEVATSTARALESTLGHDVILSVGDEIGTSPDASLLPAGETRAVALPFGNGAIGEITLVAASGFAISLEAAVDDGSLVSAALSALQAGADVIEPVIGLAAITDYAGEIATDTLLSTVGGDFALVAISENDERVACIVVRLVDDEPEIAPPVTEPAKTTVALALDPYVDAPAAVAGTPAVARYEFQPLGDGHGGMTAPRPLALLNDVEMEVIAELGRHRMKMRDLMGLEIGSVIELDRAAGSPVDVMVNGALVAHGEVVVIDEEFGIRVSEIVTGDN